MSVNFYDEVWVIDHSTTTAQATTLVGGTGVGGDLVYRFGNTAAYGSAQPPIFDHVHHPNFSNDNNTQMLFFSNGETAERSIVFELQLPAQLSLDPNIENPPEIVWQFSHPEMYYLVSGAVKLPNGNVLICEDDFGFWEINPRSKMKDISLGFGVPIPFLD